MPDPTAVRVLCSSAAHTRALGRALGTRLSGGDVVVLTGALGAGKTTFVQGLAVGLGVTAPVTSPTFVLARHQRPDPTGPRPDGPDLVHVDAYRLAGPLELDDLDLDSDLDRAVVVVEWGEGLAERLSPRRVEVRIDRDTRAAAALQAPTGEPGADDRGGRDELGEPDEPRAVDLAVVGGHPGLGPAALTALTALTADLEAPC